MSYSLALAPSLLPSRLAAAHGTGDVTWWGGTGVVTLTPGPLLQALLLLLLQRQLQIFCHHCAVFLFVCFSRLRNCHSDCLHHGCLATSHVAAAAAERGVSCLSLCVPYVRWS